MLERLKNIVIIKNHILYSSQQSLFASLRRQNIDLKLGYLLRSNGKFHEKGVDVQIAVDIVKYSIKNKYGHYFLISSDTDLLPAIKTAIDEKKKVTYIGFENNISKALLINCSSYKILTLKEVIKFKK